MSFIDSLANRLGYSKRPALVDPAHFALYSPAKTELPDKPPGWLLHTAAAEQWTMPDPSQAQGQSALYRRLSWVQAAVGSVANFAATVPFEVKQRQGKKKVDIDNHPFEVLLSRPNPLQSRLEFLVEVFSYFRITGNTYIWRNQPGPGQAPQELWILPPHQVTPKPDGRMFLAGYEYDPLDGSPPVLLEPWEVVHLRTFNPDSWFVGLSPLEALKKAAQADLAQQSWNLDYFAKNNAKIAGALAFADNMDNTRWGQLKADVSDNHGGAMRKDLMLLRGVGQGAVHFLPMAMSQKDMEFLAGRQFTMEEIFRLFAPGLASLTAINATEANAKAGDSTFRAMAVWPLLSSLAEKINNDVLPAYGDGLIGEFEDVRIKDKAQELAEMQEFAKTHTIDEVREREGSEPIGDERGKLLVVQITPQSGGIQEPATPPALMGDTPKIDGQREPDAPNPKEPKDPTAADNATQQDAERKQLKAWLRKPGRDWHDFKAHSLTLDEVEAIAEEAATEQPPFGDGRHIRRIAAKRVQLGNEDPRSQVERQFAAQMEMSLQQWLHTVLPPGTTETEVLQWEQRLLAGNARFRDVLEIALQHAADLGTATSFDTLGRSGFSFDYTLVNTRARDWARQYSYELVSQITETTRQAMQQAVGDWIESGEPLPALVRQIQQAGTFGRDRALLIAQTETTRASAEAEEIAYRESGVVKQKEWDAANDRLVCPVCGALHGQRVPIGAEFAPGIPNPPAHPGCRCSTRPVVEV